MGIATDPHEVTMTCMWHAGQNAQTEINRASPAIVADGFEENQKHALLWAMCTRRFAKENEAYGAEVARRGAQDRKRARQEGRRG